MNKSSIVIVALVALAVGFSASWYVGTQKKIELEAGLWFGEQARPLPEFELIDHNNQRLTRADFEGSWNLVFFGFTHCPDICPMSLQTMDQMVKAISDPDVAEAVRVFFISVDPERDTPERLSSYVTFFNPEFTGATAPMDRLQPLTQSLGIMHQLRNKTEGSTTYDVDHSAAIVLVNPRGEFAGLFSAPHDALAMARDMTRIVEYN